MKIIIIVFTIFNILAISAQNIDYSSLIGSEVLIDHSSRIDNPYILHYKFHSKNEIDSLVYKPYLIGESENILYKKYENDLNNNSVDYIKVLYKISFKFKGEYSSIIKYSISKNKTRQNKIFIVKNINNIWQELKKSNYPSIESIVKNSTIEMFWQFYSKENDSKYAEINKLKPLVKNSNGVINIEKLAQVLKENRASLSKYLDE